MLVIIHWFFLWFTAEILVICIIGVECVSFFLYMFFLILSGFMFCWWTLFLLSIMMCIFLCFIESCSSNILLDVLEYNL